MVGLIDGVADATASITKVFSDYLSDRMGWREPLILIGYGLGALSKRLFAPAGTAPVIMGARFADRIGKGLCGAPRAALVADVTPPEIRGRAFGLRQSIDRLGAFLGPLIAIVAMAALAKVESAILKDHAACCVSEAIASGDAEQQRDMFSELVDLFEKVRR